jgi:hypothetical protein
MRVGAEGVQKKRDKGDIEVWLLKAVIERSDSGWA